MQPYRMLAILASVFRLCGIFGIIGSLILFLLTLPVLGTVSAVLQVLATLFSALVVLGLGELLAATLEIVTQLRAQKETLARLEVKVNNLKVSSQ